MWPALAYAAKTPSALDSLCTARRQTVVTRSRGAVEGVWAGQPTEASED